jgi:hypothetical protein
MTMHKLARELDETGRQTAAMVDGISQAVAVLADRSVPGELARERAVGLIVHALQGQDRIEQRCHNLAAAIRQIADMPQGALPGAYDAVWSRLTLDELRVPELSGVAATVSSGDAELF